MIYMISVNCPVLWLTSVFGNENLVNLILAAVVMIIMTAGEKINLIHSLYFTSMIWCKFPNRCPPSVRFRPSLN